MSYFILLKFKLFFALSLFFCSAVVLSEEGHRHHEAHQHGLGELGIVLAGKELSIALRAPASDMIGFEHVAESKNELKAVSNLEKTLGEFTKLFILSSEANCAQSDLKISHSLRKKAQSKIEAESHSHADSSSHSFSESSSHSEVSAKYLFSCTALEKLDSIQLTLFSTFASLKKIQASIVTSENQYQKQLTPSSSTLILAQ